MIINEHSQLTISVSLRSRTVGLDMLNNLINKNNTMAFTVRPTPDEERMLELLKKELGVKMTTQAVLMAATYYMNERQQLQARFDVTDKELLKLQNKYRKLKDTILVRESADWNIKKIINDAE